MKMLRCFHAVLYEHHGNCSHIYPFSSASADVQMKQLKTGITVISWLSGLGDSIYGLNLCYQASFTCTLLIVLDSFQMKATMTMVKKGFAVVLGFQGRKHKESALPL